MQEEKNAWKSEFYLFVILTYVNEFVFVRVEKRNNKYMYIYLFKKYNKNKCKIKEFKI